MIQPTTLPDHDYPLQALDSTYSRALENAIGGHINTSAIGHLLADEPNKRRKVYLEFVDTDRWRMMTALKRAGFEMDTLRRVRETALNALPAQRGLSCLVTGTALAIRRFLEENSQVHLASVDLPEYSWLSASHERVSALS